MKDGIQVNQYLTIAGDGTGDPNYIDDYTVPITIFIQPAADEIMIIHDLAIHVSDAGAMPAYVYGGLATALPVGIDIKITDNRSVAKSILPELIKQNDSLHHFGGKDFSLINFSGGVDSISAGYNFKEVGLPIILHGSKNHKIEVILSDDFSGLVDHHFIAKGCK